ncbi:acyl-CoA carboxylase subunit epsilon [Actinacidiphila acidipaludis]|uniref:Acyl-CoA carboxylase subunit epsilon n=1 Tax=Actinacidiphila acidipaludis TaxID=2873382 RepID=A0ABS7Q229_9ACTN|nr:acyl-CoA carboxylase subunit epsilon [Streptomyces acidipaludis]MBY8877182.1 acyl-CoA carboxylase subunit epsilon [Streptomyces acidipaludis]
MVIKVERGRPTPEELAAVVALVQARAAAAEAPADGPVPRAVWADPARNVPRRLPTPGPGAWRMSAWPA